MTKRIVIVGGVAGGASAAARLRRLREDLEILILERGPHVSFANCGLPYYLGREIQNKNKLLVQTPQRLHDVFGLDVRVKNEVLRIDPDQQEIEIRNLITNDVYREQYDDLILSTGAAPLVPRLPGIDRPGQFVLRNIPDMEQIDLWIEQHPIQKAVVVGGGFIGLEVAEQLHRRGLKVHLAQSLPQVLAPLDPEMAAHVHIELQKQGIDLYLNNPVQAFEESPNKETALASIVVLRDGKRLPADLVVLGLGVRPEVSLAKAAGLEIGERGGIRVNEYLQTSHPHIWAIGDAIEVRHAITEEWSLIPLAGPANRQGRMVADTILGQPTKYDGTYGTAIVRVFDLTIASTGANQAALDRANIPYQMVHTHANSHAGYYPGAQAIALKILFAPDTGRLLGAQAIGKEGVDKRIDVLATALKAHMTVDDLADLELAYAPPFGSAKDPINLIGMAAQNIRRGYVQVIHWKDLPQLDPQRMILLDVRDPSEREQGTIPNSISIPLPELRNRLKELPKDREIIVHCQSGQRSYIACRMLQQHGWKCRNLSGSYKTWKATTQLIHTGGVQ